MKARYICEATPASKEIVLGLHRSGIMRAKHSPADIQGLPLQRSRLGQVAGAAELLEHTPEIVKADGGVEVPMAKLPPADIQSLPKQRSCLGQVAGPSELLEHEGEVIKTRGGVGMLGAGHLHADLQGTLMQIPRLGEFVLLAQKPAQVVEAGCGVGVLGADLLADRQGALVQRLRPD